MAGDCGGGGMVVDGSETARTTGVLPGCVERYVRPETKTPADI
ncbi:MAG: hypothetical protein OXC68_03790 [Aestuariivita sp.]|nr:hypothetical protein [Aestuariivita sp.]